MNAGHPVMAWRNRRAPLPSGNARRSKFRRWILCIALPVAPAIPLWGAVEVPGEPVCPRVSETARSFLARVARRSLQDYALGLQPYQPAYVPAELESLSAEVIVRVRQGGFLYAEAAAGPAPLATAVRDATLTAVQTQNPGHTLDAEQVRRFLIEIEVIGAAQPIRVDGDWTQPGVLDALIEPGIHGMVFRGPRGQRRFCPTEVFTSDIVLADAFKAVAQHVLTDPSQVNTAELLRFRTLHWVEPGPNEPVVSLHRGLTVLPPDAVTQSSLSESVSSIAEHMAYRQRASGLFAYQYEPARDVYSDEDNVVRQVGATLAMSVHARMSGASASRAAADLGIRRHLQGLTVIPGLEKAGFIATPDRRNKLGTTALLCTALAHHPQADSYTEIREQLVNGMLWLQRPSGMFITAFPPAVQIDAQDYFPGEALLALATEYDRHPSADILEAFDRAIAFYQGYFRDNPSPAFMPWQVQAFALIAQHTKRKDYVDFVFELSDWLAGMQLHSMNCPWPELWGGISSYQAGRAGIATASYLEGFADALTLARRMGDERRATKYEKVVRAAARFVMQLQVRPEEAYFIRSTTDAVGAIRTAPALNLLRIDHCQHALIALIKTRQVLFADPE